VRAPLDTDAMRRAARLLVGTRDFSSFRAADDEREDPRVTLQRCDVVECGDEVHVEVRAPGFLKYMVRTIVGTLLAVGRAKIPAGDVERIVEARDRSAAGPTAPARGLVLVEVFYDGSRPPRPPPAASATTSSGP